MTAPFSPAPLYFGVASSTLITTNRGVMPIGSLVGGAWIVWNGVDWEQATIALAGSNQPTYLVTLSDNRALRCSANYNWYVQTPEFVTYQDRWTSQLVVGSSVIWRTLLPTQGNYSMGAYPTIASVAPTGVTEDLFYITTRTGLVLLNGIVVSCGKAPEGVSASTPTPAPAPAPAPAPSFPWGVTLPPRPPVRDSIFFNYVVDATVPTLVTFTSHSNDPDAVIISYRWEFGDGQVALTPNTAYRYRYSANPYYVRLTVRYQDGSYGVASGTIRFPVAVSTPPSGGSPAPGGFMEPVPFFRGPIASNPTAFDPLWLGRLTNGTVTPISGVDTSTNNGGYEKDVYFTFALPAGATNVTINLTDNSSGDFATGAGYLLTRPGSASSDGDNDLGSNTAEATDPNAQNVFASALADSLVMAGEYFVSLDINNVAPLDGMSIVVAWTDPDTPPPLNSVVDGDNGELWAMNSLPTNSMYATCDFLFNLLGQSTDEEASGDYAVSYWSVTVPGRYVLCVTLDDNAAGDLAAQALLYSAPLLNITLDGPFSSAYAGIWVDDPLVAFTGGTYSDTRQPTPSPPPPNESDINAADSYSRVPMSLQYVNPTPDPTTVYVSVANYSPTTYNAVRLLANLTPASATALLEVALAGL